MRNTHGSARLAIATECGIISEVQNRKNTNKGVVSIFKIWLIGFLMVVAQGVLSYFDGFFSKRQMREQGLKGWSYLQHGGMWADPFVAVMVAYVMTKYDLPYMTIGGLSCFAIAMTITGVALSIYSKGGLEIPEAHTHHGKTTPAGWVHALFAAIAIWVCLMFFFIKFTPVPSVADVIMVSITLSALFVIGVMKFSRRWTWTRPVVIQVIAEMALVWLAAAIRILILR